MKKRVILFLLLFIVVFASVKLCINKTFFKTKYIGIQGQEIFIPRFSYFKDECCKTAAVFHSLKSKKSLKKEIMNYMKDFEYFDDETPNGYKKGDLFIQSYEVIDKGLYRKIIITY